MKFARIAGVLLVGGALLLTAAPSQAEITIHRYRVNLNENPRGPIDLARELMSNPMVVGAIAVVAQSYGVPPGYITAGAAALRGQLRSQGQEHFFDVAAPAGSSICAARIVEPRFGY